MKLRDTCRTPGDQLLVLEDRDNNASSLISRDLAGFPNLSEDWSEFLEDSHATGFQQLSWNITYIPWLPFQILNFVPPSKFQRVMGG